jgi:serine/threonine-protein kinase
MTHGETTLGKRYKLRSKIGEGGMGAVYAAEDLVLGRSVAIKLLRAERSDQAAQIVRFQREARAAAMIKHPNVCEVYDFGVGEDENPYIVMPLLQGETLDAAIRREGQLSLDRAGRIVDHLLSGLSAAHAVGVIHRDLKPKNLFLCDLNDGEDHIRILDFGISKVIVDGPGHQETITREDSVLGTPEYMAPEQALDARKIDARADIYTAGVILYEMLAGRRPCEGETQGQVLWAIWNAPITPPRAHRRDLPPAVEQVVMRALARERDDRFPSAEAMRLALLEARDEPLPAMTSPDRTIEDSSASGEVPATAVTLDDQVQPSPSVASQGSLVTRGRPVSWLMVMAGLAAAATVVAFAWVGAKHEPFPTSLDLSESSSIHSPISEAPAGEPVAVPSEPPAPVEIASSPAPPPSTASEDAHEDVRITLWGVPPGASIAVDGQRIDAPTFTVRRDRGEVRVTVVAAGHQPWRRTVSTDESTTVPVRLRPTTPAPSPSPPDEGAPPPIEPRPIGAFGEVP